jgi:hypothetical protein
MSGLVRIRSESSNVRNLVRRWQHRHVASGAIHPSDPSTVLVTADTSVEALEDLVRALQGGTVEVEIIWRDGQILRA